MLGTQQIVESPKLEVVLLGETHINYYRRDIYKQLDRIPHTWEEYYSKEDIFNMLLTGELQLWAVGTKTAYVLFVMTQVVVFPKTKILNVLLAFGSLYPGALDLLFATFGRFCAIKNIDKIDIHDGRGGWGRVLRRFGFRPKQTILSVELKPEGLH